MVSSLLFEVEPQANGINLPTFSDLYIDALFNATYAMEIFTESGEITPGQMAWVDDKVEALRDIADILEVSFPRAILDTRVELLDQVT